MENTQRAINCSCNISQDMMVPAAIQWRETGVLVLAAFALVTCFVGIQSGPALGDHECINALAARNIVETGNWLIPHVSEIPRIRKPPLGIWLIAAASYVVDGPSVSPPVSDYAARLPSAIAAWGTVMLIYWLGRLMYGYRTGLITGFIAAGCVGILVYARNAQVDMVLTFFTTLSFACFWRGVIHQSPSRWYIAGFYISFALAMMAKAPLPLVTVGLTLALYWFVAIPASMTAEKRRTAPNAVLLTFLDSARSQLKQLHCLWLIPGICLFLLIAGVWPVLVYVNFPGVLDLWRAEYLDRFTGEMCDKSQPLLYYLPILFGMTAPFFLSLPEALAAPFLKRYGSSRSGLVLAFTWALVGTCFLSASEFKRPHYVISVLPACCLLLGPVIDRVFFGAFAVTRSSVRMTCVFIPVLLLSGAIAGGFVLSRHYPSLLRVYIPSAAVAVTLWITACYSFFRNRRGLSFAKLNLGVLVLIFAIWPGTDRVIKMNQESTALAEMLRANNVRANDMIFWVDGRPDSSIEFYSEFHIRRLINEIEITQFRDHRKMLSEELYREYTKRIRCQLTASEPVYLVLSSLYLDMIRDNTDLDPVVLFKLQGFRKDAEDDLVVITGTKRIPFDENPKVATLSR